MHSVNLGSSAPRLSNARVHRDPSSGSDPVSPSGEAVATKLTLSQEIRCDISYVDTVAISISTSVLFNYPFPSFARLPVSLTISLALFAAPVSGWHGRISVANLTDGRLATGPSNPAASPLTTPDNHVHASVASFRLHA